jgi:hypothetical protein
LIAERAPGRHRSPVVGQGADAICPAFAFAAQELSKESGSTAGLPEKGFVLPVVVGFLPGAAPEVRVHPRAKVERHRDLFQECDHRPSFAVGKPLRELVVQSGDQSVDPVNQGEARFGKAHAKRSPVARAAVALHPAGGLQLVDQAHHVVAMEPESISQLLLSRTITSSG